MSEDSKSAKDGIRSLHRERRAGMDARQRDEAGAGLAAHGLEWANNVAGGTPSTFCLYLGVGFEPPTGPLMAALHARGHGVLLPVCEPGRRLSWVHWTPEAEFVRSRYAPILEPAGTRHGLEIMATVAGLFIPATALDRSGNRIGQGGGYYDVFLGSLASSRPDVRLAAIIYDHELLPAGTLPSEDFDRKVPAALTPSGLIRLGNASGRTTTPGPG
ncbi:5-formyltetrahydrofolate cyclo-ligase [Arthrobacter sp. ISL-48]|uniref:5-formyltetrahydrofolate cyclo-ligase n=1 Tax=Arthrobacter sp. ISL-48 TaxID=2819110 RepID=UPI001BEC2BA3|nr:5-formyltetrahydrofolate cyclo-ligase [Arthrobacter sp. ISL-48]MBT2532016.1 5-formyltetrahydrofolate cyclo-ligase [Arthrobacter sp. ISL-48]